MTTQFEKECIGNLECPVCLEFMDKGTRLCEKGHAMCESCGQRTRKCLWCSSKVLTRNNLKLESFIIKYLGDPSTIVQAKKCFKKGTAGQQTRKRLP